jgi:TRAP-type uncharacterized transport system substrate-binding protein
VGSFVFNPQRPRHGSSIYQGSYKNQIKSPDPRTVALDDSVFQYLVNLGWRKYTIRPGRFKNLNQDYTCIDYSGWPLYTRASLPDEDAYKICAAIMARKDEISWEDSYTGVGQLGQDSDATPRDVPLHPGAEKWYREHGFKV